MSKRNLVCAAVLVAVFSMAARAADTTIIVVLSNDPGVEVGSAFYEGDRINSTDGLELTMPDGSDVQLEKNTQVRVSQMRPNQSPPVTKIQLLHGGFRAQVAHRPGQTFQVATPVSTAGVRGTDFSVAYEPGSSTAVVDDVEAADIDVYDGTVDVTQTSTGTSQPIPAGSGATVAKRRLARRAVSEERREQWEDRRDAIIEALKRRWNISGDEDLAEKIKERLKSLSPERRDAIRDRLREHIKDLRERMQRRRAMRPGSGPGNPPPGAENRIERRQERRARR